MIWRYYWRRLLWWLNPPLPWMPPPQEEVILLGGPADGRRCEIDAATRHLIIPVAREMQAQYVEDRTDLALLLLSKPQFVQVKYTRVADSYVIEGGKKIAVLRYVGENV